MKPNSLILLAIMAATCWMACDNELDLTEAKEDIPIVYGFLSRQDTAHYIRVERAFLDPEKSPLDIAQIPDSLYYDNATVQINRLSSGDVFDFVRVDGASEGYPREEGIFATTPNFLYKLDLPNGEELAEGESYQLLLKRGPGFNVVTAETRIVSDLRLTRPFESALMEGLTINYSNDFTVAWRYSSDAFLFDVIMVFNYLEQDPESGEFVPKTVEFVVTRNFRRDSDNSSQEKFKGELFYQAIGNSIDATDQRQRIFQSIDILIFAGGQEMEEFLDRISANSGLTGAEVVPTFSNLSEGFGVFTSRNVSVTEGYPLKANSLDSLRNGIYTGDLNFQ